MVAIPCAAGGHRHYCSNSGSAGLESHTWLYFAVFTGVIVGLILEPVPGAVVAMVGISIIAILSPWLLFSPEQLAQPGFKFTAKSLSWAVSGFLIRLSG